MDKVYLGGGVYAEKYLGTLIVLTDCEDNDVICLNAESLKNLIQFVCDAEQEKKDGD